MPHTCPKCGESLERGHIMGVPGYSGWLTYAGDSPTTIGWLSRPPRGRGLSDQLDAEPLAKGGWLRWSRNPRFPAVRCVKCHWVEFSYENVVYRPESSESGTEVGTPPLAPSKT